MAKSFSFEAYGNILGISVERVIISFNYSEGRAARLHTDPPEPQEFDEVEVWSIMDLQGAEVVHGWWRVRDQIEELCREHLAGLDDGSAYADHLYDQMKDKKLEDMA